MSSGTVASRAFAGRVSPRATGRWLLSFFKVVSEALAIQEVLGPGMLPSAMMLSVGDNASEITFQAQRTVGRPEPK